MAAPKTWVDPEEILDGWFAPDLKIGGWFDPELADFVQPSTWSVIQKGSGRSTDNGSISVSLPSVQAGSTLILVISHCSAEGSGAPTSITGATFTLAVASTTDADLGGDYPGKVRIYYAANVTAGSKTIVANLSGEDYGFMTVMEVAGLSTSPLDVVSGAGAGTSALAISGTTAATSQADEIVVAGLLTVNNDPTSNISTAFDYVNIGNEQDGSIYVGASHDYKALQDTGAQVATWTLDSAKWTTAIATFKAADATVRPSGFDPDFDFGTPAASVQSTPSGFDPDFDFGTPSVGAQANPIGFDPDFDFGSPTLTATVGATGFAAPFAFGTPVLTGGLAVAGLTAPFAFGAPALSFGLSPEGFAAPFAFGAPSVGAGVTVDGFTPVFVFGTPVFSDDPHPVGFDVPVQFGAPSLSLAVSPSGFDAAFSIGIPDLFPTPGGGLRAYAWIG